MKQRGTDMTVEIVEAYGRLDDIRMLFTEYVTWLGLPLDFQNYDEEYARLPGEYAPPDGRLFLALVDGAPAGCVALKPFDSDLAGRRCEMKRLFVRDTCKGLGLGRQLAEQVIATAGQIGYDYMLLDSLDFMERAVCMYRSLGFEEIAPYRFNPVPNTVYMCLALKK